jgi:hypothetical protein
MSHTLVFGSFAEFLIPGAPATTKFDENLGLSQASEQGDRMKILSGVSQSQGVMNNSKLYSIGDQDGNVNIEHNIHPAAGDAESATFHLHRARSIKMTTSKLCTTQVFIPEIQMWIMMTNKIAIRMTTTRRNWRWRTKSRVTVTAI